MDQLESFVVGAESVGQRLDEFLAGRLHRLSRMRIGGLVAAGASAVNGVTAHGGWRLRAGDVVELNAGGEGPNAMTPEPLPLAVVYEDAHLVVVDKPAGLLAHPTRGVKSGTLANALAFHLNRLRIEESFEFRVSGSELGDSPELGTRNSKPETSFHSQWVRPGIVHRLDRATSGLMVVAKTQEALSRLSRHFHRRLVEKRYLAVVHGLVTEDERTIRAPVGRVAERAPAWGVTAAGKPAETRLRVVERGDGFTLVELEPVTGRTNQLRIHCAHAGHAIVGDEWYAADARPRLCLHAARLAFRHPADNRWAEFASPLPDEVRAIFEGGA
ncbi:MAG: RluA family pseudouridine synthase [Acidobacteriota bacterium]|nr:RluA family pseudouridine synthase [Acidobacteriota bacterium]